MNKIRAKLNSLRVQGPRHWPGIKWSRPESNRPKKKRGFDLTTFIAALALIVSVAQLLVTAPVLLKIFVKPRLEVVQVQISNARDDFYSGAGGIFIVRNNGSAPATKVELGLMLFSDQKVTVIPNVSGQVISEQDDSLVRTRVEFEHLQPVEEVLVMVTPSNRGMPDAPNQAGAKDEFSLGLPKVFFIRSAEGQGEFRRPSNNLR